MIAVAAGAAVFAESIDWSTHSRSRKSARGTVSVGTNIDLTVNYASRTPDNKAKIALKLGSPGVPGSAFQVDSLDTGWSSDVLRSRMRLILEVPLAKPGDNAFKLFVFDPSGGPLSLAHNRIVITRTAATVDAVPASQLDRRRGSRHARRPPEAILLGEGPEISFRQRGVERFKATESLRARRAGLDQIQGMGRATSLIQCRDNTFVGLFEITGNDFVDGVIPAGADLMLTYEIGYGGNIDLQVEFRPLAAHSTTRRISIPARVGSRIFRKPPSASMRTQPRPPGI